MVELEIVYANCAIYKPRLHCTFFQSTPFQVPTVFSAECTFSILDLLMNQLGSRPLEISHFAFTFLSHFLL